MAILFVYCCCASVVPHPRPSKGSRLTTSHYAQHQVILALKSKLTLELGKKIMLLKPPVSQIVPDAVLLVLPLPAALPVVSQPPLDHANVGPSLPSDQAGVCPSLHLDQASVGASPPPDQASVTSPSTLPSPNATPFAPQRHLTHLLLSPHCPWIMLTPVPHCHLLKLASVPPIR